MSNINDSYFDGYYKEIWKTVIPDELTVKEVEFMVPFFNLDKSSKVLDLMCGYGRHSIGLARKGIAVTAVDNLDAYIKEINEVVEQEKLPLTTVKADVVSYTPGKDFDLVICMGNSFNFFNAEEALKLLTTVAASLKKGGHLLINSWTLAEITFPNFKGRSWSTVGDIKFLVDSKFMLQPARVETESTMIAPDGTTEIKNGVDYIYSINEMEAMFKQAGLTLEEVYSIPGRKKFTLGEPRAYLVGVKN